MAIRASSSPSIEPLVKDLDHSNAVTRDAAVARLTVIGARAVERLIARADSTAGAAAGIARAAAFRALEGIGDPRALEPAMRALADRDPGVATAAVGVASVFVRSKNGATAVDGLTRTALDERRPDAVRIAAIRALRDLEASTLAPVLARLSADPSSAVSVEALREGPSARHQAPAGGNDPASIRQTIVESGDHAPLPALLGLLERVREREAAEPAARRAEWTTTRAAAHLALARRRSRLALYDLRESLERAARPLPVDMLAALALVGDGSCLEPIAAAYTKSADAWWRGHLVETFRAIVKREKLTRRHAVMKKLAARWPRVMPALSGRQ